MQEPRYYRSCLLSPLLLLLALGSVCCADVGELDGTTNDIAPLEAVPSFNVFPLWVSSTGWPNHVLKDDTLEEDNEVKRQFSPGKRLLLIGKRQWVGGMPETVDMPETRQFSAGKRQFSAGKRQFSAGKRQFSAGKREWMDDEADMLEDEDEKRQFTAGKRQFSAGKRQFSAGKRQFSAGKRQFSAGKRDLDQDLTPREEYLAMEMLPAPETRQFSAGKRQFSAGKRQFSAGKRQFSAGKRQWVGGEYDPEEYLNMETRQFSAGKRQFSAGKRQFSAGKRQWVGGEVLPDMETRQFSAGKRQFSAGKRQFSAGKRDETNILDEILDEEPAAANSLSE